MKEQVHETAAKKIPNPSTDPTMIQVAPDFRMSEPRIGFVKGKPYMIRVCEELIGDRWEGFVSMTPCADSPAIN